MRARVHLLPVQTQCVLTEMTVITSFDNMHLLKFSTLPAMMFYTITKQTCEEEIQKGLAALIIMNGSCKLIHTVTLALYFPVRH